VVHVHQPCVPAVCGSLCVHAQGELLMRRRYSSALFTCWRTSAYVCDLLQVTVSGTFLAVAQTVSGGSVDPLLTIQNAPGTQFWVAGELFVLLTGGSASTSTSLYLARVGATSVAVSAIAVFPNGLGVGEEIFVWAYGNAWTVTFQVRRLAHLCDHPSA
jgi:hypothetical protein